jgi:hypothetical protein
MEKMENNESIDKFYDQPEGTNEFILKTLGCLAVLAAISLIIFLYLFS